MMYFMLIRTETFFKNRYPDFACMVAFLMFATMVFSWIYGSHFIMHEPFIFAMMYVWCNVYVMLLYVSFFWVWTRTHLHTYLGRGNVWCCVMPPVCVRHYGSSNSMSPARKMVDAARMCGDRREPARWRFVFGELWICLRGVFWTWLALASLVQGEC